MMDLEARVQVIEDKLDHLTEVLTSMSGKLDTIEVGIYGDNKNKYQGVLDRQESQQKEIDSLKAQIKGIIEKSAEEAISLKAKKSTWLTVIEILKWLGLAYLVAKGVFGIDTLFNKLF